MKRLLVATFLFVFGFSGYAAAADELVWPDNPVIGLIGASIVNATTPEESGAHGMAVGGGSYLDLTSALIQRPSLQTHRFLSNFQAGAFSYDIPATGFKGFETQYADMQNRASWFGTGSHLKGLIIVAPNDCIHTTQCTIDDIYAMTDTITSVAEDAVSKGLAVIITDRFPYEGLDLDWVAEIYHKDYVISEEEYTILQQIYQEELSTIDGVVYVNPWNNMSTIDGLHPDAKSMKAAAVKLTSSILKLDL